MMPYCPAFAADAPYLPALAHHVDCQMSALATTMYNGFGGLNGQLVTVCLTLYCAFLGYRMMLGEMPHVKGVTLIFVRLGFVLALATQWPAYQQIVYNVVVGVPGAFMPALAQMSGADSTAPLAERLQTDIKDLNTKISKLPSADSSATPNKSDAAAEQTDQTSAPSQPSQMSPTAETLQLSSRILLITGAVDFVGVRLASGLLLGLGPIFILLALFEPGQALAQAWVRALIALIFISLATRLSLLFEISLLEPQITAFSSAQTGNDAILATAFIGSSISIFAAVIGLLIGGTLRWPSAQSLATWSSAWKSNQIVERAQQLAAPSTTIIEPVNSIAIAAVAASRRDQMSFSRIVERGGDAPSKASIADIYRPVTANDLAGRTMRVASSQNERDAK